MDTFSRSDRSEFWLNGSRPELHVNVTRCKLTCETTSTTCTRTTECIFTTICAGALVLHMKYLKNKGMICYFDTLRHYGPDWSFLVRKKKRGSFPFQNSRGVPSEIFCFFDFCRQKKKTVDDTQETYPGALNILNKAEFCFVDSYQFGITLKLDYHFPPWPED